MISFSLPYSDAGSHSGETISLNEVHNMITYSWDDTVGASFLSAVKKVTKDVTQNEYGFIHCIQSLESVTGNETVYESRSSELEAKYKV